MRRRLRHSILICVTGSVVPLHAQVLNPGLWETNGSVQAIVRSGKTIYLGGNFTYVGPATGNGVVLDPSSGVLSAASPVIDGVVHAVVGDGNGGWYVGGEFNTVNRVERLHLAHILANGSLDNLWNPRPDGPVHSMALGTAGLYIGGVFTAAGGQPRRNAALLDLANGTALNWNPNPNADVLAIAVSDPFVYLGGAFTAVGALSISRNFLARTDLNVGAPDTVWNPNPNSFVLSIAAPPGQNNVWIGGYFTSVTGRLRSFLASVSVGGSGTVAGWDPSPDGIISAMIFAGGRLYVGGSFSTIGGTPRGNAAAVDPFLATPYLWNPDANSGVNALAVSGGTVYLGGDFTQLGGQTRFHLAAMDSAGIGTVRPWNPMSGSTAQALALQNAIFAGGYFTSVNGVPRSSLAALYDTSGVVTSFNPNVLGVEGATVYALSLIGSTLYAGGEFTTVGTQPRMNLAAVNATTGIPTAWNPGTDGPVYALKNSAGNMVVGGSFTTAGGLPRNNIASIDLATGSPTQWNPGANSAVLALDAGDSSVYAGGVFSSIGGAQRNSMAKIDLMSGVATAWNPDTGPQSSVSALLVRDNVLFAGGNFLTVGGQPRHSVAALDLVTGAATAFNASLDSAAYVNAMVIGSNNLYLGGILHAGGTDLVAVDPVSGIRRSWNPAVSGSVAAITTGDTTVYAAGMLASVLKQTRTGFAGISDGSLLLPAVSISPRAIDFDSVSAGQTGVDSVLVRNTGGSTLVLSDSSSNIRFAVTPRAATIPSGGGQYFRISFTPINPGPQNATVTFTHNAPGSPATVAVSGIGVGGGPVFLVSRTNIQFGDVHVDSLRSDTLTVRNTGTDTLRVTGITNANPRFSIVPASATIIPGGGIVFTVSFAPAARGLLADTLRFTHNAGVPTQVSLAGRGIASSVLPLTPAVQFDTVGVGTSQSRTALLLNDGNADLTVDSVRISGTNASEFSVSGLLSNVVPALDTLRIPLIFTPATIQATKTARLVLFSNAVTNPDTIILRGAGRSSRIQVSIPGDTALGHPLTLNAQGPAGFQAATAFLHFRQGGRSGFDSLELSVSGQNFNATFPESVVTARGIEYFVQLADVQGIRVRYPEIDWDIHPAVIRVNVGRLVSPRPLVPRQYRMISMPLELTDHRIDAQLADDFGPYDPARWRVFRWEDGANHEYPSIVRNFDPGYASWVITQAGGSFDAKNGKSVATIPSSGSYTIELRSGWNQIASPFAFPVAWSPEFDSTLVSPPYWWDGTAYVPDVRVLEPWEGYFVENRSQSVQVIALPSVEVPPGLPKAVSPFAASGSENFVVQLSASAGSLRDPYTFVGITRGASQSDDAVDLAEPPMIGDYVNLSIREKGRNYISNFKPLNQAGQAWELRLTSTLPNQTVSIVLMEKGTLPSGFELHMLDEDEFAPLPLRENTCAISLREAHSVRSLKIIIGTRKFAEQSSAGIPLVPVAFSLEQNFPNPFNPSTTIRYSLAKRSAVVLGIFNTLGQQVKTLVRAEQTTGAFSVIWDGSTDAGSSAASGVYFSVLRAGEYRAAKKLLLMR